MEFSENNAGSNKVILPKDKAHRLIAPRIVYIVTSLDKSGRVNAGSFSNLTSVSIDPERLVLGVYKKWDTIKNIRATREFVVNVPSKVLLEQVWICGDKYAGNPIPSGINELKIAGLTEIPSEVVAPPRIAECYGHLECRVIWVQDVGDHYLVLADIVSSSFTKGFLDNDFILNVSASKPLMEVSRNIFTFPEGIIQVSKQKIKIKVKNELEHMKIKIPKRLSDYEKW
jgi:flavin reductase (DIM6/NTAB) family NADH-FMN oxidoreductase RutF